MSTTRRADATSPVKLDGAWIATGLDRDADYPSLDGRPMGRVFMKRDTGELVEVAQGAGEPSSHSWLEIPVPDHRQRHTWFRAFLRDIGCEDEYFGSIGRWLKDYGSDARDNMWLEFRSQRVVEHVIAVCRRAGIDVDVV